MKVWLIQTGEPLRGIDGDVRPFRVAMLADALIDAGHNIVWWSSTFDHFNKRYRYRFYKAIRLSSRMTIRMLHGSPPYRRNLSLTRLLHHRSIARSFFKHATDTPLPDLIFCCLPTIELALEAVRFGQRHRIPVVIDVRDVWPDIYLHAFPSFMRGLGRVLLHGEFRKVRALLKDAAAVTAVSESYLNWALSSAKRQRTSAERVFPIGFRMSRFNDLELTSAVAALRQHIAADASEFLITFSGTFGASYDLLSVIHTARALESDAVRNVRFAIAGSGDQNERLRAEARGCHTVSFLGWLENIELAALKSLANVGLAPYRSIAMQSLPNKPFEYMAASLPILSSLKGELAKLIETEQIGLQYEAGNVCSLRGAILSMLNDRCEIAEMGRRGRRLFESRFDEKRIYPKMAAYLADMARYH